MLELYQDVQKLFASHGFVNTPMSFEDFKILKNLEYSRNEIYQFGCDLAANYEFDYLVEFYNEERDNRLKMNQ